MFHPEQQLGQEISLDPPFISNICAEILCFCLFCSLISFLGMYLIEVAEGAIK